MFGPPRQPALVWFLVRHTWLMGLVERVEANVAMVRWRSISVTGTVGDLQDICRTNFTDEVLACLHREARTVCVGNPIATTLMELSNEGAVSLIRWQYAKAFVANGRLGIPGEVVRTISLNADWWILGLWPLPTDSPSTVVCQLRQVRQREFKGITQAWSAGFLDFHCTLSRFAEVKKKNHEITIDEHEKGEVSGEGVEGIGEVF